jgi:hypothetical protein
LIVLFIFINISSFTIEKYVDIEMIKNESAPRFLSEGVLITVSQNRGNTVFLRTNIDGWKDDHYFKKSLYGIRYFIIPYDKKTDRVLYKLNIDGFWDKDPNNNNVMEDKYGTEISYVNVPNEYRYVQKSPEIEQTDSRIKKVTFYYFNPKAAEVNFVCSLDNWNQFTHQMKLNSEGYWEFSMSFKKGLYSYYFLVDEKKVVDKDNDFKIVDESIGDVSGFVIE